VIFTNADISHARRVLAVLQLEDCFEQIIDIRAVGFICKPDPDAYPLAQKIAGVTDPQKCILFDDAPRNLAPAQAQGWYTVLVGAPGTDASACQIISSLHELPQAMPQLWNHQRSHFHLSRILNE
jgi:FMN phosphatase YigB (HAD superfamily)